VIEVKDEKIDNEEKVKEVEGKRIIEKLDKNFFNIFMDLHGEELSSEKLATYTQNLIDRGIGNLCFVIAGSLGYSKEVLNYANYRLSLSKMTFTHQMTRLLVLEQIYRVFKINNNEVYHKWENIINIEVKFTSFFIIFSIILYIWFRYVRKRIFLLLFYLFMIEYKCIYILS